MLIENTFKYLQIFSCSLCSHLLWELIMFISWSSPKNWQCLIFLSGHDKISVLSEKSKHFKVLELPDHSSLEILENFPNFHSFTKLNILWILSTFLGQCYQSVPHKLKTCSCHEEILDFKRAPILTLLLFLKMMYCSIFLKKFRNKNEFASGQRQSKSLC